MSENNKMNKESTSIGVQCSEQPKVNKDKSVQVHTNHDYDITTTWDTDKKLFTMTGIPSLKLLEVMVKICGDIRPTENCAVSLRKRILLTMHKLKSNFTFDQLGILFQITTATAELYFADIIQLLALGMKGLIHWQSRQENLNSLPKSFRNYPNVKTVLDCMKFKTSKSKCLRCRNCTCCGNTLKLIIGVTPSTSVNYLSGVAIETCGDKMNFNLTDLVIKLEPGDAVMIDNDFLISDELVNAGIEIIRPDILVEKSQVEPAKITSARAHVRLRIGRLKQMKVLSDKILCCSIAPYLDDIMIVICALSNLSPPILSDDMF